MCLMDEDYSLECDPSKIPRLESQPLMKLQIDGALKTDIAKMFREIFADGLCLPERGDFGEVAVALYLLFCGDVLRKNNNTESEDGRKPYHKLSVDFFEWMKIVTRNDGNKKQGVTQEDAAKKDATKTVGTPLERDIQCSINCIQFFRQPLCFDLKYLAGDTFLKSLYEKGCAIYCANNTEAVDLVLPVSVVTKEKITLYLPVFVSVQNHAEMYPKEAAKSLAKSLKALQRCGVDYGLVLLAIVGQDRKNVNDYNKAALELKPGEDSTEEENAKLTNTFNTLEPALGANLEELQEKVVGRIVSIHEDEFGIHQALLAGSIQKDHQMSEVYGVHSELLHTNLGKQEKKLVDFDTHRYRKGAKVFLTDTLNCVNDHSMSTGATTGRTSG